MADSLIARDENSILRAAACDTLWALMPSRVIYMLRNPARREARLVVQLQLIIAGLGMMLGLLMGGYQQAWTFGGGALVGFLPTLFIYRSLFRYFGASQVPKMLRVLYLGELLKLAAAVFGLAILFMCSSSPEWGLLGFVLMLGGYWVIPFFQKASLND